MILFPISSIMNKFSNVAPLSIPQILELLGQFLQGLQLNQITVQPKLKFTIKPIIELPRNLLQAAFLFLLRTRFPWLLEAKKQTIYCYDQYLKDFYQQQLQKNRLKSQFNFDFFLVVVSKLCLNFLNKTYQAIAIDQQIEAELYCLLIKGLLGLNLSVSSYRLLQKKFIDQQKYSPVKRESNAGQAHSITANHSNSLTKSTITLNTIQAKLQKRKLKKFLKTSQTSFQIFDSRPQFNRFREDLNNSLKVRLQNIKKEKLRYNQMERQSIKNEKQGDEQKKTSKRQVIYNEQISSSLKLSLFLKNIQHSYTRRDISLRHSSPSPRLTNKTYEIESVKRAQALNFNKQNKGEGQQRGSIKFQTCCLLKNSKTYWNKKKDQLKAINQSFLFQILVHQTSYLLKQTLAQIYKKCLYFQFILRYDQQWFKKGQFYLYALQSQ